MRELNSSNVDVLLRDMLRQETLFALDLTDYSRVTLPALMSTVVTAIHWKSMRGVHDSIPVRLPSDPMLRAYLLESSIANFVGPNGDEPFSMRQDIVTRAHPKTHFIVPVSMVAKKLDQYQDYEVECGRFLNRIADTLEGPLITQMKYSAADVRKFWSPNKEIIFNIFEHSESWGLGAIVKDAAGMVVSYADLGVGIPATMGVSEGDDDYQSTADAQAVENAFQFGVSRFSQQGRGTGLSDTLRFVVEHGGTVECRSGRARVRFSRGTSTFKPALKIPGTQITLLLPQLGTR